MRSIVVAEQTIRVGQKVVIEGASPCMPVAAVFEDDGDTGYFYALDNSRQDNPIVDALHIYDVAEVADRDIPSQVQILWSADGLKAALSINGYIHAVFDFEARRGYCRDGFPPPVQSSGWTRYRHEWDDKAIDLFR
jgi:hypothetical protein